MNNNKSSKSQRNFSIAALLSDSGNSRIYLFDDVNIIGRSENAVVCLQDPLISRKHCIISKLEDNKFTICDTSTSGTFVNDKKLVKNRVQNLHHKDKISFGHQAKHIYIFFINKKLSMLSDKSEYLNSQMKVQMSHLETSHSVELMQLNSELHKIDLEKLKLENEMNSRLKSQEDSFKAEKLSMSNLVISTQEQKDDAEKKLQEMRLKFDAEEKKLKDEIESKFASMVKKEEELQQLKIEMELKHQQDKQELEERCRAEIEELKLKLALAELEQDRLQEETRDVQQQLAESKQILLESEIEQNRLADEKDEVETKLIDLTKESTFKDDVVVDLKRKLKEKEEEEERRRKVVEQLEEHLMCSICAELFIQPTVLNCGHMFCKSCIEEWKMKKKICPFCRAKITACIEVYNLDSIIEKDVALLSAEAKQHREDLIKERKQAPCKLPKKNKRRSVAVSPYMRPDTTPRHMIPMVQINNDITHAMQLQENALHTAASTTQHVDLATDPFTWRINDERRPPIARMEVADPVAEIDLTNIILPGLSGPQGQNAVAYTSTSLNPVAEIDLTNILDQTVPRTPNATVTSTSTRGLIDLTTL